MPYPKNVEERHRKNAAEWVMWCALWPVAMVMRLVAGREMSGNDNRRR
jgi:hypothetical protein